MGRLKKLKKIRIHREGTHILAIGLLFFLVINSLVYYYVDCKLLFYPLATCKYCYLWINGEFLSLPYPFIRRRYK
jgi:hypothetical protein